MRFHFLLFPPSLSSPSLVSPLSVVFPLSSLRLPIHLTRSLVSFLSKRNSSEWLPFLSSSLFSLSHLSFLDVLFPFQVIGLPSCTSPFHLHIPFLCLSSFASLSPILTLSRSFTPAVHISSHSHLPFLCFLPSPVSSILIPFHVFLPPSVLLHTWLYIMLLWEFT